MLDFVCFTAYFFSVYQSEIVQARLIMTCCYDPVNHFISSNKRQIIYQKLLIQWRHVQQVLTEGTMTPNWHIVTPLLYSVRK